MRLLTYPDNFETKKVYSIFQEYVSLVDVNVTCNPADSFDVVLYWSYHRTVGSKDAILEEIGEHYDIINGGCDDVTKSRNEAVMKLAFGYNSLLYPEYKGEMLKKSQKQGLHDVKIVTGPCRQEDGYIYCKLLDSRIDEKTVRDHRVYVFDGEVALTIYKDKPVEKRFGRGNVAKMRIADNPFTDDELQKIKKYCSLYGSQITELDVLRDNGNLYIVDNNNVPAYGNWTRKIIEGDEVNKLAGRFHETLKRHAK